MGIIQHHAIIFTVDVEDASAFYEKARSIFENSVSMPVPGTRNGYVSFLIAPDGSKEGWDESNAGDQRRAEFKAWLRQSKRYPDWVEVSYGEIECKLIDSYQDET